MVVPHCLHQEGVVLQEAVEKRPGHEALPYSPVLHDLSLTPRNMRAVEVVEFWLEMYETKDVTEWYDHMELIDMPSLQLCFAGMFGHIMLLEWGYNQTVDIATPFMGMWAPYIIYS